MDGAQKHGLRSHCWMLTRFNKKKHAAPLNLEHSLGKI